MHTARVDVAILGAGPAGCATALRLRQHAPGLSVAILDASGNGSPPVGETLPPPAQDVLRGLGVWPAFLAQEHVQNFGIVSTWGGGGLGGVDFIATPYARGWHLDRRRFDRLLLDEAQRRGATVLADTRFQQAARSAGGWTLTLAAGGRSRAHRLDCAFVVDATGRRARFATRNGARRVPDDSMVALCRFYAFGGQAPRDTRLVLEPVRDGWWYAATLPGRRALAVFMTDGDIAKPLYLTEGRRFARALEATGIVRDRFETASAQSAPARAAALSGCLSPPAGERWVAVGDAASTFDPLCGQGILKAMTNGVHAAYAIADALRGDDRGLARYARDVTHTHERYLDARDGFYATERRWPDSLFWRRRQPRITLDPMARIAAARPAASPRHGLARRILGALGTTPCAAHEVVRRVKAQRPDGPSDARIVLTVQGLIRNGAVVRE